MTRKVDTYRGFDIIVKDDGVHVAEFGPVRLVAQTMAEIRQEVYRWWDCDPRVIPGETWTKEEQS